MAGDHATILVLTAHPDDELDIAYMLNYAAAQGHRVLVRSVTNGGNGSNGDRPRVRLAEGKDAGILGGWDFNLLGKDGESIDDHIATETAGLASDTDVYETPELVDAVTDLIKRERPDLVLAPYWKEDDIFKPGHLRHHPDHIQLGRAVHTAHGNTRLRKSGDGGEPWADYAFASYYLPHSVVGGPATYEAVMPSVFKANLWPELMQAYVSQGESMAALEAYKHTLHRSIRSVPEQGLSEVVLLEGTANPAQLNRLRTLLTQEVFPLGR